MIIEGVNNFFVGVYEAKLLRMKCCAINFERKSYEIRVTAATKSVYTYPYFPMKRSFFIRFHT